MSERETSEAHRIVIERDPAGKRAGKWRWSIERSYSYPPRQWHTKKRGTAWSLQAAEAKAKRAMFGPIMRRTRREVLIVDDGVSSYSAADEPPGLPAKFLDKVPPRSAR